MWSKKVKLIAATVAGAVLLASVGTFVAMSASSSYDKSPVEETVTNKELPLEDLENAPELVDWEAPASAEESQFEEFEATAYCDFGITFSGVLVQRGIVAADPRILPIGSVIEVKAGDYSGIYTVMDTGGVVKGRIIDLYMPDYEEAIQFGRQKVQVRIIRKGWHPEAATEFGQTVAGG